MVAIDMYFAAISLLLGLVIGSFLNVVIFRLPEGRSLVRPASRCPSCGHAIRWYHNVPVIGWLVLHGRCRDCGEPISARYPLIEGLTGLIFLAAYVVLGLTPQLVLAWAFLAALLAVSFIDLDHYIIPNAIVIPGAVIGLAVSTVMHPQRWWEFLMAGVGAAAFLLAIGLIWPGGMGFGDVKLALMMGAVLGRFVLVALFLAFLVGGVAGVALIALKLKSRRDRVPFGPYLAMGSTLGLLVGEGILDAYLSLYA